MAVVLVVGPPCGGKNYAVEAQWRDGDVLIDYDALMSATTRRPAHEHLEPAHWLVYDAIGGMYNRLERDGYSRGTAWVVTATPDEARRERLRQHLKARVLTVDPGIETCCTRAEARSDSAQWNRAIGKWYSGGAATNAPRG